MKDNVARVERAIFRYINAQPALLSLLYDMNLLPDQVMDSRGSYDYHRMITLVCWFRALKKKKFRI